jgi:hypothetical protein
MKKWWSRFVLIATVVLFVLGTVFIFNQTTQFLDIFKAVSSELYNSFLIFFILFYGIVLLLPVYILFKLPKTLVPPQNQDSKEYEIYLRKLKKRLQNNILLKGCTIESEEDIQKAFLILDDKANQLIKTSSTSVFLSTAISQNGKMDGLIVLFTQIVMIWRISKIYLNRPSFRDLLALYTNVFSTVFIATNLEEIAITEQMQPLLAPVLSSSLISTIPGSGIVVKIITDSLVQGTGNSLLTLRIGVLSKKYFNTIEQKEKCFLYRSASVEALGMLADTIGNTARLVSKSILKAAYKSSTQAAMGLMDTATCASNSVREFVSSTITTTISTIETTSKSTTDSIANASRYLLKNTFVFIIKRNLCKETLGTKNV